MRYYSEFKSINDVLYGVEIITNNSTSVTQNFTLGGNPFVTQMDADGKTIYAPIKTTAATIEMIVETMPFDIYTTSHQGTKITLTNKTNNTIEWVGYATPCAYTQGFDRSRETLEIEAVDGIASLKDVPFQTTLEIDTFINIIFKILKRANCYKYLYVSDNIKLTPTDTTEILSKLRISERNFFDEKEYEGQSDDDVAWSCYDVLYEIMQYMGYTIIAHGQDVYIIDYDAIITSHNNYFRYDISGTNISTSTKIQLSNSYKITGESYAENGSNISLSELFNNVVVVDEFTKIDSLTNGVDNQKNYTNITAPTDATLKQWQNNNSRFLEADVFTVKNKLNEDENFTVLITKGDKGAIYFVICKFYSNPLITTEHYDHYNNSPIPDAHFNPMMYSRLWDGKGAYLVGYFTKEVESKIYNQWRVNYPSNWDSLSKDAKLNAYGKLCNMTNIGNKKLTNYILCLNQDSAHIEYDKVKNYPFFQIKKNIPTIFGGDGGYIVLKGTLIRHYMYNCPFPMNGSCYVHKDERATSIYANEGYIWARLKWGNYYWKCEGSYTDRGEWVTTPSYFKIFYGDPTRETRCETWQDTDVKFYNNCGILWGVDGEDGYYIPTPPNGNLTGTIDLVIYANFDSLGRFARNNARDKKNSRNGFKPKVMLYKDLDITAGYSDDALNEEAASSDTVYTNDVSGYNNIQKMKEIKFKICTYDNKTPSYSTVDYLVNGTSQYLDTTYNQSTNMSLRQEQHFVIKNVSQYEKARVEYECNIKNSIGLKPYSLITDKTLTNYKFIINTMDVDYKYNKINLKITEKNNIYQ